MIVVVAVLPTNLLLLTRRMIFHPLEVRGIQILITDEGHVILGEGERGGQVKQLLKVCLD
jgi:hypothetical protein